MSLLYLNEDDEIELYISPLLTLNEGIGLIMHNYYHVEKNFILSLNDGTILDGSLTFDECGLREGEVINCRV